MDSPPNNDRTEAVLVWAFWGLMVLAGLGFVAVYGFTMPYGDEWAWLPVVAGQQPASLSWFWSLHNEHRVPLPRLIYLGLGKLSSFDFRAAPFYNILVLSGLSLAMMLAARRIRGRTSIYDVFFPLLLLHWAQCEDIAWGFQLQFITSVALAGAVLLIIVRCGPRLGLGAALATTVLLALLALCGLNGLAYLPALMCWLVFAGICRWRDAGPHARRDGLLLVASAAALLALLVGYFIGFHHQAFKSPGILASLSTALQFLSGGIGPAAREIWPVSGVLTAVACGYALWQLYDVLRRRPQQRVRAAGLLCFLGGMCSLALAIGAGRAYAGPKAGFMERYMTIAAPLLCLFYLQFTLYCPPRVKIHWQRTLALLMLGLLAVNIPKGLRYGNDYRVLITQLEADMRAGLSPTNLATRHGEDLGFGPNELFATRLEMLRAARLGPYRDALEPIDPALLVEPLSGTPPSREPVERLCLLPGQAVTQYFQLRANAILSRIDVQLSECRDCRTMDRLNWRLCAVRPNGRGPVLAHGAIDMRPVGHNHFVSLAIVADRPAGTAADSPLPSPAGVATGSEPQRFALIFSPPAECPAGYGVDLPLSRCAEATQKLIETEPRRSLSDAALTLKGFLFLKCPLR